MHYNKLYSIFIGKRKIIIVLVKQHGVKKKTKTKKPSIHNCIAIIILLFFF